MAKFSPPRQEAGSRLDHGLVVGAAGGDFLSPCSKRDYSQSTRFSVQRRASLLNVNAGGCEAKETEKRTPQTHRERISYFFELQPPHRKFSIAEKSGTVTTYGLRGVHFRGCRRRQSTGKKSLPGESDVQLWGPEFKLVGSIHLFEIFFQISNAAQQRPLSGRLAHASRRHCCGRTTYPRRRGLLQLHPLAGESPERAAVLVARAFFSVLFSGKSRVRVRSYFWHEIFFSLRSRRARSKQVFS